MSESAARNFNHLWQNFTNVCHNNNNNNNTSQDSGMSVTRPADMRKDLQSPPGRSKYAWMSYGDSPSDAERSQDIIWDATSPTQPAKSLRRHRVVNISDIVNRIAPKGSKPKGADSSLLQWIGDGAIPSTPEVRKPRSRKKSSRHSSVDDLMILAQQFDQNMKQEIDASEQKSLTDEQRPTTSEDEARPREEEVPASGGTEAELQALFDCSTQSVSGRLSQSFSTQSHSQQPLSKESEPAEEKEAGNLDDDDWENDDILDSFVLEMTKNPEKSKSPARSDTHSFQRDSNLQELSPKTKTSTRSTFRLQSNPHFQPAVSQKSNHETNSPNKCDENEASADALWDDGFDDDDLLCQACDSVEQLSDVPPKPDGKTSAPLPIESRPNTSRSTSLVRSQSLPFTGGAASFRGWDATMRGANVSQSLPAGRIDATFLSSTSEREKNKTKPHQSSFKRNLSDSAVIGNKVFISSRAAGECSAAEIERKKQEAQARRRLRKQNQHRP